MKKPFLIRFQETISAENSTNEFLGRGTMTKTRPGDKDLDWNDNSLASFPDSVSKPGDSMALTESLVAAANADEKEQGITVQATL